MHHRSMKRSLIFYVILNMSVVNCLGQPDMQMSIDTDEGIVTVSKTHEGNDVINFNCSTWNEMVKGTKYTSEKLQYGKYYKVIVEISSAAFQCNAGIGFSCSIFDDNKIITAPVDVNNKNRFATATIRLQLPDTVTMIFIDTISWNTLKK